MRLWTVFVLAHKENTVEKFIAKVTQTGVLVEMQFHGFCSCLFNSKMVPVGSIQTKYRMEYGQRQSVFAPWDTT